ncbi:MAG TPA: DUF4129 domain-containing protein [Gaiellaceae bacterium]|nr:DUF4129 domain-containing protein [Gaiellaceae bacterium]
MRGRATSVVLPALVVLALVAVVALAATGSTPGGDDSTRPPSEALLDSIFTLGLIAVAIGGVLLVYGLMQRKAIAREIASGRHRRISVAGFVAFFAIFTAFTYWRLSEWRGPGEEGEQELDSPGDTQLPTLPPEAETSYEPSVAWVPVVVVALLVLVAVVAFVVAERRANRARHPGEGLAEQLAVVLDDTLDDLRAEADPRRAIIAAYARLERVLAANGIPRRASETSDEYLARVLSSLELGSGAVERLTALFERAKFSQHDVDTTMKEEAIGALEQARDELRLVRDAPPVLAATTATRASS